VHEEEPFNAETGLAALAEHPLTATDAFYVRAHGAVPEIDAAAWRLHVQGLVERELSLSLATLREAFREREATATLQCAGNRRAGLMAIRDIPGEAPWGPGATGTATWTGIALADVLALAGPLREAAHVGFDGADLCFEAKPAQRFGGSIPLDKAWRPEVLLAWGMNGKPLPAVHGAPLRVVVPGYIGARSVKWLERIEVRSEPWHGRRHAARPRRAQRRRTVSGQRRDGPRRPSRCARLRIRRRGATRRAGRRLPRRRRELVADRAARGPRPVGLAALADHRRPRAR
jgi:sulfite oxidase